MSPEESTAELILDYIRGMVTELPPQEYRDVTERVWAAMDADLYAYDDQHPEMPV